MAFDEYTTCRSRIDLLRGRIRQHDTSSPRDLRTLDTLIDELTLLEQYLAIPHNEESTDSVEQALDILPYMHRVQYAKSIYQEADMLTYLHSNRAKAYCAVPFRDAPTIKVQYRHGELQRVVLCQSDTHGRDFTACGAVIKDIPMVIPEQGDVEVTGTISMPLFVLLQLNDLRHHHGQPRWLHRTSALNDIIRWKKIPRDILRELSFIPRLSPVYVTSHNTPSQILNILKQWGFRVENGCTFTSDDATTIHKYRHELMSSGDTHDLPMSGCVVYAEEPHTSAIIYQFPHSIYTATLGQLHHRVQCNGIIQSTVQLLNPSEIDGQLITEVFFPNTNQHMLQMYGYGCVAEINVNEPFFPTLGRVILPSPCQGMTYIAPTICPECGGQLHLIQDHLHCLNKQCQSRNLEHSK